jgi:hypothetical protein
VRRRWRRRERWRKSSLGPSDCCTAKWAFHCAGDAQRISVAGGFTVGHRVADTDRDCNAVAESDAGADGNANGERLLRHRRCQLPADANADAVEM